MPPEADLLEREDELAALADAIEASRRGAGRFVVIEGGAGLGKTRLLGAARVRAEAAGMHVLSARGGELERSFAFGIVRQLLEPALARGTPEEKAEVLAGAAALAAPVFEAAPVESTSRPGQEGTLAVLHGLFWLAANLAERRPLLLTIDDAHWTDPPSLDWLGYLLRRVEGLPVLVAIALRPAEPASDRVLLAELAADPLSTVLRPAPLSAAGTRQLVGQALAAEPAAEFCTACHRASGGNPLLLRELLDGLAAAGVAPAASEVRRLRDIGPPAVSRSVRLRLAHLPTEANALARAVAVLGDAADLTHAAALAELERGTAAEAAAMLADVDLLHRVPPLAFVHPLVREAVYAELRPGEREQAHARAAVTLAAHEAPSEQVAAHLLIAPPVGSRWAVQTLREAARHALARSAAQNAAAYLRRALAEPPPTEQQADLLFELGSAEALIRDPGATAHLRRALATTGDPRRRVEIELVLARLLFWKNATTEAVEVLDKAATRLPSEEAGLRERLKAELVGIALSDPSTHPIGARRLASTPEPSGDSVGARMLLAFGAYHDAFRGQSRNRCIQRAERALAGGAILAEEGSWSYWAAALALMYADRVDLADAAFATALSAATAAGAPGSFAAASCGLAAAESLLGSLLDAEANARHALAACPQDQPVLTAYIGSTLGAILTRRGDLEGAAQALSRTGIGEAEVPRSPHLIPLLCNRARLRLAQGAPAAALADCLAIGPALEALGSPNPAVAPWRSDATLALLALGDRDKARRLAGEELVLARSWGSPVSVGRALRALGLAEGGRPGLKLLHQAAEVLEHSTTRLELIDVQVDLGSALRRTNQRAAARDLLRHCLEQAHRSGAGLLAERAHAELLATGARPRRPVRTGVDSLTASERRIAVMASEGMTNRDIAQALFVTPKTVEMHLGNVFHKLDIHSRTQLAAILAAETRLTSKAMPLATQ